MLFSNRDYFFTTEPIDTKLQSQAQDFFTDNEAVTHTFEGRNYTFISFARIF